MSPTFAILAAEFNRPLVDSMLEAAHAELKLMGLATAKVVRVPGSFELPLAAEVLLPDVAGLVVLGYIEKGETLHGEVMGHVVYRSLVESQVKHMKPIGLGIIGPGATPEQAKVRAVPCAQAAVNALVRMHRLLTSGE